MQFVIQYNVVALASSVFHHKQYYYIKFAFNSIEKKIYGEKAEDK